MKTKLRNYSASQLKSFWSCNRYWAFQKILKVPFPTSKSMALGTAVHSAIEGYINGEQAKTKEFDRYVKAAKPVFDPMPEPVTEHYFKLDTPTGVPCVGYIDLHDKPPHGVVDWKTTSNLYWAPTRFKLYKDPQAQIYAKAYSVLFPETESVPVGFMYLETRLKTKVNTKFVETKYTQSEIDRHWDKACGAFEEMYELARDLDPTLEAVRTVKKNTKACSNFGGCPYLEKCRPHER